MIAAVPQTQTSAQPPPQRLSERDAGRVALLTMIVAIIGVLLITGLLAAMLERRRRRLRRLSPTRAGRRIDPWFAAGQRAATPQPHELDDTGASGKEE